MLINEFEVIMEFFFKFNFVQKYFYGVMKLFTEKICYWAWGIRYWTFQPV